MKTFINKKSDFYIISFALLVLLTAGIIGCSKNSDTPAPVLPPVLASFSPSSGIAGDTIIISGSNFDTDKAKDIIKFGSTIATVVSATATQIKVIVPDGDNSGKINIAIGTNSITAATDFSMINLYIAGFEVNGKSVAKYWKNRIGVALTDGTKNATATCIAIHGNDVYVGGYEDNAGGNLSIAKYWKNGMAVQLSDGTKNAKVNAIAVIGNDVYAAGYEEFKSIPLIHVAKYWKNGTAVVLTNGTKDAYATGIALFPSEPVEGVYVTGSEMGNLGVPIAKYWKDGTATSLPASTFQYASSATSIAISSDLKVYMAGSDGPFAPTWIDGKAAQIFGKQNSSVVQINSIAVPGGNLHTVGTENNINGLNQRAKYWTSSKEVNLTNGATIAGAYGITTFGSDVFIAGFETNASGKYVAKYWKNGIVQKDLTSGATNAWAMAIVVTP
jgi:IPT/TIG domain